MDQHYSIKRSKLLEFVTYASSPLFLVIWMTALAMSYGIHGAMGVGAGYEIERLFFSSMTVTGFFVTIALTSMFVALFYPHKTPLEQRLIVVLFGVPMIVILNFMAWELIMPKDQNGALLITYQAVAASTMINAGIFSSLQGALLWLVSHNGFVRRMAVTGGIQNSGVMALRARVGQELTGQLIRLESQDHYTNVVTTRGHKLVLMRFGDAIDDLEQVDGMRVQRSHWVAWDQVQSVARENRRLVLTMSDGTKVPTSPSNKDTILEALEKRAISLDRPVAAGAKVQPSNA